MAEIPLPTGDLDDLKIELDQNFQVNRSDWTGRRWVSQLPGAQKWYASATVKDIATEIDERPWRAFLISLRGPVNWFRLPVACNQWSGANPTVRAGGGPFTTLPLAGLPASQIGILEPGQYMTVPLPSGRRRLVMLIAPLSSDAAGNAVASFLPELTETPATGAVVEAVNPWLRAALTDSRQGWTVSNGVSNFALNLEEAL